MVHMTDEHLPAVPTVDVVGIVAKRKVEISEILRSVPPSSVAFVIAEFITASALDSMKNPADFDAASAKIREVANHIGDSINESAEDARVADSWKIVAALYNVMVDYYITKLCCVATDDEFVELKKVVEEMSHDGEMRGRRKNVERDAMYG